MAKEVAGLIKLQIKGGAANPSPPVGPALGSKGINIMGFCKEFNARTQDKAGKIIPVVITYYTDKSFTFELKTPPAAPALRKTMTEFITRKYKAGEGDAVSYKMDSEPYLYWPVSESELKVNNQLKQNPVWIQEKTTSKN